MSGLHLHGPIAGGVCSKTFLGLQIRDSFDWPFSRDSVFFSPRRGGAQIDPFPSFGTHKPSILDVD